MGIVSFSGAKKAASTLESTSCCNLRFAQGWRGSTKIGWNFFYDFPKVENIPKETANIFESTCRNQVAGRESLTGIWHLGGIFFCEWVKKTESFILILSLQESNLSSDLVDSATMASPRPFSAAGRFRDTRVIGENFNGGGL